MIVKENEVKLNSVIMEMMKKFPKGVDLKTKWMTQKWSM